LAFLLELPSLADNKYVSFRNFRESSSNLEYFKNKDKEMRIVPREGFGGDLSDSRQILSLTLVNTLHLLTYMSLRNHPLMVRKSGYHIWPPIWTTTGLDPNDKPVGEIGILHQVLMNDYLNSRIFMFIEFERHKYMGAMQFDDAKFSSAIYALLQSHVGCLIEEIGDLDLSHMHIL
jgi:hypothetical protein